MNFKMPYPYSTLNSEKTNIFENFLISNLGQYNNPLKKDLWAVIQMEVRLPKRKLTIKNLELVG
jgi:hypothetical protein